MKGEAELGRAPPLLPDCPKPLSRAWWPAHFATAAPASGSGLSLAGSGPSALADPLPPSSPDKPPIGSNRRPVGCACARGGGGRRGGGGLSHAITCAGRFRCAARAAGTGLPGDPWCAVAAASSAPVPRRRSCPCCLPREARGLTARPPPAPGALGRRRPSLCANLRPSAPLSRLRSATRRESEKRLWRLPRRVSPGGAAGPGLLQPPGCVRELSAPLSFYRCHDWSRLSPAAGSASAPTSALVEPRGRAPPGM